MIVSNDMNDIKYGFEKTKHSTVRFVKYVKLEELSFVFKKVQLLYRWVPFTKKHNMKMFDKDEYVLTVKLSEIDEINQKWIPLPQYNK